MDINAKLQALGLSLPPPPAAGGNYLPYRMAGSLLYLAGVISVRDGQILDGQVGGERDLAFGQEAAQVCGLNALAVIHLALDGDWTRLSHLVSVSGYVNAVAAYPDSPLVINGASNLFNEVLGDAGAHARAAVAVAGLPKNASVEIQVVAALKA